MNGSLQKEEQDLGKAESKRLELTLASCTKKKVRRCVRGLPDKSCGLQEGEQSQLSVSWQGENLAGDSFHRLPLVKPN